MYENSIFSCKNHFCLDDICEMRDASYVTAHQMHHFSSLPSDVDCIPFTGIGRGQMRYLSNILNQSIKSFDLKRRYAAEVIHDAKSTMHTELLGKP